MNPWVIIVFAVGLLSAYSFGYYSGWQGKTDAYTLAALETGENTRIDSEKVDKGHDIASKEIRKTPSNGCVGTGSAAAVDWLQHNYRK